MVFKQFVLFAKQIEQQHQDLNKQLTGINTNYDYQHKLRTII